MTVVQALDSKAAFTPDTTSDVQLAQIFLNLNDWTLNIELGFQTAVVYIDFAKAFDTVSHHRLFLKLHAYGILGKLLSWFSNFLSDRIIQTRINSSSSQPENLLSGVIQGSGVGPIMLVMFTNDLIDALKRFGVFVKLFADDVKIYIRILNNCDVLQLKCALNTLTNSNHMAVDYFC